MPDEFPTLEVVALIGVVAALVGMLQLRRGLSEIPKLAEALERALRAGKLAEARALCGQAEGAAFARIGAALIDALEREPRPAARELEHVVTAARKRATKRAQRGRARDVVVAAVLIGAGAYALRAALGVGPVFYAMIVAALAVTALSPILRRALLDKIVKASAGLLQAGTAYLGLTTGKGALACPECHSRDAVRVGGAALANVRDLGLSELLVCRSCGLVRGRVERPREIVADEARGIELPASAGGELPSTEGLSAPVHDHEHEG